MSIIETSVEPAFTLGNNRTLAEVRKLRRLGVEPPCLILGNAGWNQNLAYALRCTNHPRDPESVQRMIAGGTQVVWFEEEATSGPLRHGVDQGEAAGPAALDAAGRLSQLQPAGQQR